MKKNIIFIIKLSITVLLLYFIFKKMNLTNFKDILKNTNYNYIVISLAFTPLIIFLRSFKWFTLLKYSEIKISYWDAFKSITGGMAFGIITPGRVGEVTRSLFIKHAKKAEISGLVLLDRIFDLYVIVFYSLYGVLFLLRNNALSIFSILLFVFMTIFIFFRVISKYFSTFGRNSKLNSLKKLNIFIKEFGNISGINATFLILVSLIMYFLTFIQFYFLILSFSPQTNINFLIIVKTSPLIQFMSVIPITLFGLGIREGTSIYLLGIFGINKVIAFNSSFLSFVFNILLTALIGVFFIIGMGKRKNVYNKE